jgi:hypothetical protein
MHTYFEGNALPVCCRMKDMTIEMLRSEITNGFTNHKDIYIQNYLQTFFIPTYPSTRGKEMHRKVNCSKL